MLIKGLEIGDFQTAREFVRLNEIFFVPFYSSFFLIGVAKPQLVCCQGSVIVLADGFRKVFTLKGRPSFSLRRVVNSPRQQRRVSVRRRYEARRLSRPGGRRQPLH